VDVLRWVGDGDAQVAVLLLILGAGFVVLAWREMRHRPPTDGSRFWQDLAVLVALGIVVIATLLTTSGRDEPPQLRLLPLANLIDAIAGHGSLRGALAEMLANVLLFAPLGMALSWRFPSLGVVRITLATLAVSVGVEVLQAVEQAGRWASTTDVLMNALGGMIGALAAGAGPVTSPQDS
jgi:VanZ family protein